MQSPLPLIGGGVENSTVYFKSGNSVNFKDEIIGAGLSLEDITADNFKIVLTTGNFGTLQCGIGNGWDLKPNGGNTSCNSTISYNNTTGYVSATVATSFIYGNGSYGDKPSYGRFTPAGNMILGIILDLSSTPFTN